MGQRIQLALVGLLAASAVARAARADAIVMVDASADLHPISPLIYGVNFPDAAQLDAGRLTVMRWGGNSTTRYDYETDIHNTGSDWYFENIPACAGNDPCPQADPKEQSSANDFLNSAATHKLMALFTIPTIGWAPKQPGVYQHPYVCGCPKSAVAQQDSFDQYDSNCGNGKQNNAFIMCPAATTTSRAVDPSWAKGWVQYLVGKFGAGGGKRIYALDNEPALWSSTHHDVHPERLSYDELWQRMRDYAAAIVEADPSAELAGPVEWGWPNYLCSDADQISNGCSASSPDRAAHGGEELVAWLLDQAKAYEMANNVRVLHYLDLHYYPQGGNVPDNTRSLWDPNYTDPSWINDKIHLIPRMHDWVEQHYPGTKISISEYDFGEHDSAIGAVTYAEVLGIFGREALDMATAWSPPAATERAFSAFKLFRNYDGSGAGFESTSARATVSGSGVQAFAATSSTRLTVVLVNEGNASADVTVQIAGFQPSASASVWSNAAGADITQQPDVMVAADSLHASLAATSIAMIVVEGKNPNMLPSVPAMDASVPTDGGGSGATDAGLGTSGNAGKGASGAAGSGGAGKGASSGMGKGAGGAAAGSMTDAGTRPSGGAGTSSTGGTHAMAMMKPSSSGCGCRVESRGGANGGAVSIFALFVSAAALRLRRRQRISQPGRSAPTRGAGSMPPPRGRSCRSA